MKKRTLLTSILTIVMCLSLSIGATFALFTSKSEINIAVTSGKVNVTASIDETSVQTKELKTNYMAGTNNMYEGVATFADNSLTLKNLVPGDGIKFDIVVENESNVTVKYRTIISCNNDDGLFSGLNVSVGDKVNYDGETVIADWAQLEVGSENAIVPVVIELPEQADDTYQGKTCTISYVVEAVQGNAPVVNVTASGTTTTKNEITDVKGNSAVAPAGAKLTESALTLEVVELEETEENVQTGYFEFSNESTVCSFSVNVPQIALDNDVAIVITMDVPAGLNNVVLFHKGVAMTAVTSAEEVNEHHEFFYDAINGKVIFATKNFSNFTLVSDVENIAFVSTADELVVALENSSVKEIVLNNDIKIEPAKMSNAYGKTGINIKNNQTLNGNGFTLNIKGAGGTWDSGINITGGTIKNITVTGSFRGIFINHNSANAGKVYLENVITTGTTYTISCDQGTNNGPEATNCEFYGWTSFAATLGNATFTKCTFVAGSYNYSRPYAKTTYINCTFGEGHEMDARASVALVDCNLNGVKITAENIADLVTDNTANAGIGLFVKTADELIAALENADVKEIVFANDIKIEPAKMSNAYGTTGINIKNNQTLNGNGYTLNVKGAGGTWDSGINITGGTIKNITVTGSFRGIFINHNSANAGKVYLENVITTGTTYTISCDQGTNNGLEATNCQFYGWTSFAGTLGDATFKNCIFGEGNGYSFSRPYAKTTYIGCTFEEGYAMDAVANVVLDGCNLNGVEITTENLADLVVSNINNAKVK